MTRLAALSTAAVILSLTACTAGTPDPESVRPLDGSTFKFGLYVNSNIDDEDLHGSVILVNADGTFQAVMTAGAYNGDLARSVSQKNAIELVDQSSRIQVTSHGQVKQYAIEKEVLVAPWVGGDDSGATFVAVDEGVRNGDYVHSIIGWQGERQLASSSLRGEAWGFLTCGGVAYAVVSPWNRKSGRQSFEVLEISAQGNSVTATSVFSVAAPSNVASLEAPMCASDQIVVIGSGRDKGSALGRFDVASGEAMWSTITDAGVPTDIGSPLTVADGDHVYFIDREARTLRGIDVMSAALDRTWKLPSSANEGIYETYAVDGETFLALVERAGADPVLLTMSLQSGGVFKELEIAGLAAYLQNSREVIIGAPVSFDDE